MRLILVEHTCQPPLSFMILQQHKKNTGNFFTYDTNIITII